MTTHRGATRDLWLLLSCTFARAFSVGMVGVLLGVYLAKLRFSAGATGAVVAAGLIGATLAAVLATFTADRLGRRPFLVGLAMLGAVGCAAAALLDHPLAMGLAAFAGMLNGMGRDRGAPLILEQAALPSLAPAGGRTRAFAWYNVTQDAGHALGGLAAGIPTLLQRSGLAEMSAFRGAMGICAVATALAIPLYLRLSSAIERPPEAQKAKLTRESRRILTRISALFTLDSLGGGFLTASMLSFFFYERFGVSADRIGLLFFAARLLNAVSHFGAAWLAGRIGLVNTMVFTHVPSSLLLVTVAFAPSFPIAALFFLLREGLVEMDVPTRQSYVMAVVRPEERTIASGVTHLVRLGAWAAAPALAGLFMQRFSLLLPLIIGASLKILYDVLLYRAFSQVAPPEER